MKSVSSLIFLDHMAKSLRSKFKRKCRAEKRKRWAPKEDARLKKVLEKFPDVAKKGEIDHLVESRAVYLCCLAVA